MTTETRRGPGRPPGGPELAEQTRQRIFDAAVELFARDGYHGTGVNAISERAGIQRGALYYHITSKQNLLWEVLHAHVAEVRRGAEEIAASDQPAPKKLEALVHHQVAVIAEHRREVAIYSRDANALEPPHAAALQAERERVSEIWTEVLADGAREGSLRAVDHVTVNGILGMINLLYMWFRPDGPDTPAQIASKYYRLVSDGLKVPPG